VTISIGAANLRPSDTAQSLIERADMCLYAAKRNSRNRVICETDPEAAPLAGKPGRVIRRLLPRRIAASRLLA